MVVGPGLGNDVATGSLLSALFGFTRLRDGIGFGTAATGRGLDGADRTIATVDKPVVVDADALTWLALQESWWERVPAGLLVLTPHAGEMARLVDTDVDEILADPVRVARDAATRWSQTVVLKSGRTLVASPDGAVVSANTSPSLATAGSGDVLSGSIGALLAQGLSAADAATLAVFVGCRAAEKVARRYGTLGVVASDLPFAIAEELLALEEMGV
jgi:NAD(P)H-hydrate epimerase